MHDRSAAKQSSAMAAELTIAFVAKDSSGISGACDPLVANAIGRLETTDE
jgi:hypothetical protein